MFLLLTVFRDIVRSCGKGRTGCLFNLGFRPGVETCAPMFSIEVVCSRKRRRSFAPEKLWLYGDNVRSWLKIYKKCINFCVTKDIKKKMKIQLGRFKYF